MRKTNCLFGVLLAAGALGMGALQTQAAEPAHAGASACKAVEGQQGAACAAAKRVRAPRAVVVPMQVTKASLDRSVCGRLQGQVERDTCLNHVEANA